MIMTKTKLMELFNSGMSIEAIANEYGLVVENVHLALHQAGCDVGPTEYEKMTARIADKKTIGLNQRATAWMNHKGIEDDANTLDMLVSVIGLLDAKANYKEVRALNITGLKSIQNIAQFRKSLKEFENKQDAVNYGPLMA